MQRTEMLRAWLQQCQTLAKASWHLVALPGDASFRRYFRIHTADLSYIAVDAPPHYENSRLFVKIAAIMRHCGLQVPVVMECNFAEGFLLVSDLGDHTYLKSLHEGNADVLYQRALATLIQLQACRDEVEEVVPVFDNHRIQQELQACVEWFMQAFLHLHPPIEILYSCFAHMEHVAGAQPQVVMHRDFHSANLMVVEDQVGILDFQDLTIGPVTYDAVSLLRDCYIAWPEPKVQQWIQGYGNLLYESGAIARYSGDEWLYWFDWMGMQRHLKALFIFARKYVRDQQSLYLQHIPRTLQYLLMISQRYHQSAALYDYLKKIVQPACHERLAVCAL